MDRNAVNATVALVIPAHNEAAHIGKVLASVPTFVHRVFVIDDASTDDTAGVVASSGDARVRLIRHESNTGVGGAMRTGYAAALADGYDLIAKMDADGQMRAEELELLVAPFNLNLADYTKGNRFYFRGATQRLLLRERYAHRAECSQRSGCGRPRLDRVRSEVSGVNVGKVLLTFPPRLVAGGVARF